MRIPAAALLPVALSLTLGLLCACADKQPAKLALDPKGPFRFEKRGQSEQVKIAAFDEKGFPFTRQGAVPVTYSSSDESVVTVDATGTITATGSGKAQLKATAWGLETSADVTSTIPATVEVKVPAGTTKAAPFKMRMNAKPMQIVVVVKDDKGVVIEKPKVIFRALDYCVETTDDGLLTPLAEGPCPVLVSVADQSAKVWMDVRE